MAREYDILVLGGGPAGYPAAIRAAQLGARVCLVEKESLGGTCLNWGCIPTKALQGAAHLVERVREGAGRGIAGGPVGIDAASLFANKNRVVKDLVSGVEKIMKARRIEVLRGAGRLTSGRRSRSKGPARFRRKESSSRPVRRRRRFRSCRSTARES